LLRDQRLVRPILLGAADAVRAPAKGLGLDLQGIEVRDPRTDAAAAGHAAAYHELRRHKGVTPEAARDKVALPPLRRYDGPRGEAAGRLRPQQPDRRSCRLRS
jgi:phosphate acetyltransferase